MGSCVPGHALFSENFKGLMSGVSLGTYLSNLNSITFTVLEQLTFNAQKYRWERYPWYAPFLENFLNVISGLSQGTCLSNLKSVSVTMLQQLAFNPQKFMGSCSLAMPSFRKILRGSCPECPWEHAMLVKSEIYNFNCVGTINV